jgi:hypothetical protein
MSVDNAEAVRLIEALEKVGVLDARGGITVAKGSWGKDMECFRIGDIAIRLTRGQLSLSSAVQTVWHGSATTVIGSYDPNRGPQGFSELIAKASTDAASRQHDHDTRVYGNEW